MGGGREMVEERHERCSGFYRPGGVFFDLDAWDASESRAVPSVDCSRTYRVMTLPFKEGVQERVGRIFSQWEQADSCSELYASKL